MRFLSGFDVELCSHLATETSVALGVRGPYLPWRISRILSSCLAAEGYRSKDGDRLQRIGGLLMDCGSRFRSTLSLLHTRRRRRGGRGSPANLISEITNLGVLHHLELISVACEGHSALLALCEGASISRRRHRLCSLQDGRRRKTGEKEAVGLDPRGGQKDVKQSRQDSNGALTGSLIRHRRGGRERRPRWRLSVMIDGRWRAAEASRSALV